MDCGRNSSCSMERWGKALVFCGLIWTVLILGVFLLINYLVPPVVPMGFHPLAVYLHGSLGAAMIVFGALIGALALTVGKLRSDTALLLFSVWPISLSVTVLLLRLIFTENAG